MPIEAIRNLFRQTDRPVYYEIGGKAASDRIGLAAMKSTAMSRSEAENRETVFDILLVSDTSNHVTFDENLRWWYPKVKEGGLILVDTWAENGEPRTGVSPGQPEKPPLPLARLCREHCLTPYAVAGFWVVHKPWRHLLKYRDRHRGERVFIIGNGPSLNRTDLDLIAGEHTIAMNRISLIYPRTTWRPSYYIYTSDNIVNKKWGDQWQESVNRAISEPSTISFVWDCFAHRITAEGNIVWLQSITEYPVGRGPTFSTDAAQWLSKSGTTMNVALQMAYFMGFDPIIILGADMNWKTSNSSGGDPNHFDPGYQANIPDGETERMRMRNTHAFAYPFFRQKGRRVYNATIDTLLDVYPLVSYETVASNPDWQGGTDDEKSPGIQAKRKRIARYWTFERPWIAACKTAAIYFPRVIALFGRASLLLKKRLLS